MATIQRAVEQRLVLNAITWKEYTRMGRVFGDQPVRLTYDRGTLEIMTLSPEHERLKHLLRRLFECVAEETGIAIAGFGSMTCRRRRRKRGLEPDECYWIGNEPRVRGSDHIDLRRDPPPDLAIEVDISRSSLDRLSIYAALGVREVWRLQEQALTFYLLGADGNYTTSVTSPIFPGLSASDLLGFLNLRGQVDEISIVRQCRAWVRQNLTGGTPSKP